jgi:protease-4
LNSVTADISKSRNISVDKLNEIANGLLARTPEMAKEQKLVDIIAYEDVYHDAIKKSEKWRKTKTTTKSASLITQKMTTTG